MKETFPKYNQGDLNYIEKTISQNDKKILDKFIIFCGSTAGERKRNNIRKVMIKIIDVLETPLDRITLEKLRLFLNVLKDSELAPATKNEIKKHLKRFLKEFYPDWSKRFKELKDIKLEKDINVGKINENTIIKKEELERIINSCENIKYKTMIILLYESGGRPEEVLKLKWKDIDFNKKTVTLRSNKTGNLRINPIDKSISHLERWKKEYPFTKPLSDDYIFVSVKRGEPVSRTAVNIHFNNIGKHVLKRAFFPYLLRHTRATELQKVLRPKVYEKFMDHSIETATRYSHLNNDDVREAMLRDVYEAQELTQEKQTLIEEEVRSLKEQLEEEKEDFKQKLLLTKKEIITVQLRMKQELRKALKKLNG